MNIPKEWQIYESILRTFNAGNTTEALRTINETRVETEKIASNIACVEADCMDRIAEPHKAIDILESAAGSYPGNYWVYHSLARRYRNIGKNSECITAYRNAHELIGWEESKKNGYTFLHDYFSSNIPQWSKWFDDVITMSPITALEIGSWQGGSATWLLDKVISKRGGSLTCIDTFQGSSEHSSWIGDISEKIETIFDKNILASGHSNQCRKIVGYSQSVLRGLYSEKFDFIYIDGAHEARYVLEDTVLAFGLLNNGGFMCFDDYDFKFPDKPNQNSARAIDMFLDFYEDEITFVEKTRQVLLQKSKL